MPNDQILPFAAFVDAAQKSSRRVRLTLLGALIASVICGSAAWNLRPNHWLLEDIRELQKEISRQEAALFSSGQSINEIRDNPQTNPALYKLESLREMHAIAQKRLLDNIFFQAKFFGVYFHTNDLGFLSGLSLSLILLFLAFGFRRQLENHTAVFTESRRHRCLRETYLLLSMGQLLTAPPFLRKPQLRVSRFLPKFLIFAPLIIHSAIVYQDTYTYPDFFDHRSWAVFEAVSGNTLLVFLVLITVYCYSQSIRFDHLWVNTALEVQRAVEPDAYQPELTRESERVEQGAGGDAHLPQG